MNAAKQIIAEMIEANLQQGWAALGAKQWALAKNCFEKAVAQVDELAGATEEEEPKHEQPTLEI